MKPGEFAKYAEEMEKEGMPKLVVKSLKVSPTIRNLGLAAGTAAVATGAGAGPIGAGLAAAATLRGIRKLRLAILKSKGNKARKKFYKQIASDTGIQDLNLALGIR